MTAGQEKLTLNVQSRKPGKGRNRTFRSGKQIPGVVYGPKLENANIVLDEFSVVKYSRRAYENALFQLKSDDKNLDGVSVLMKDVQIHPVRRLPLHVDFYAVDMTQSVKVSVELKYEGKPKGVAEEGGVFQIVRRDVEVECLPNAIPDSITVDVTGVALGETLHISDLSLPDGVKTTSEADLALANVVAPAKEEPAEEAAAPAEGEAAAAPAGEDKKDEKK